MSFCACIDVYQRRTSKNNMAAFREAVMLKIALARRRRRNLSFQMATQASTASFIMFITAASDAKFWKVKKIMVFLKVEFSI